MTKKIEKKKAEDEGPAAPPPSGAPEKKAAGPLEQLEKKISEKEKSTSAGDEKKGKEEPEKKRGRGRPKGSTKKQEDIKLDFSGEALGLFWAGAFSLAADFFNNANWTLSPQEVKILSWCSVQIVEKHAPEFIKKAPAEVSLFGVLLVLVAVRIVKRPRRIHVDDQSSSGKGPERPSAGEKRRTAGQNNIDFR